MLCDWTDLQDIAASDSRSSWPGSRRDAILPPMAAGDPVRGPGFRQSVLLSNAWVWVWCGGGAWCGDWVRNFACVHRSCGLQAGNPHRSAGDAVRRDGARTPLRRLREGLCGGVLLWIASVANLNFSLFEPRASVCSWVFPGLVDQ